MARIRLALVLALAVIAAAGAAADEAGASAGDVLYLNLVWHQHQPLYYKDAGVYTRPWARVHATKDYYDMAAMLQQYPDVHVTFNLTPVLLRQLDDLAAGAKDAYQVAAEKPAVKLTEADKTFLLQRFFDANGTNVIARFPRYQELLTKRGGASDAAIAAAIPLYTIEDWRDLQLWFNLAWFDPGFLAQPPLAALVEKGRGFSEADKKTVFDQARSIVAKVVPLHKAMQDTGQIEVITTPYAHPILPLIFNSNLAAKGDPSAVLPTRFSWPNDAIAQVRKAAEDYQRRYGRAVRGMWPGEGSVGQDIVKIVADAGFRWMASGEQVLAKSIGKAGFTRSGSDVVNEADDLYRPYYVRYQDGPKVAVFFRDLRLSDLIGFEYSGTPPEKAADDFMARLEAIRARLAEQGATGPHVVSVILDGENAWESYPNDGVAFLNALYRHLSDSTTVRTVTPSEYLARYPEQRPIESLWYGCWFTPDYTTWIGEPEENLAWEYLGKTRNALAQYDLTKKKTTTPEKLAKAQDAMYLAEGSDWFWWYGSDQDSGNDRYFDDAFRALLAEVYTALGEKVPDYVRVPIIMPAAVPVSRDAEGLLTPTIDGTAAAGEWDRAGLLEAGAGAAGATAGSAAGGATALGTALLGTLQWGFDANNVYFKVETAKDLAAYGKDASLRLFLSSPQQGNGTAITPNKGVLALRAGFMVDVPAGIPGYLARFGQFDLWDILKPDGFSVASGARTVEVAVPLSVFGQLGTGDALYAQLVLAKGATDVAVVPGGPVPMRIPDLGTTKVVLALTDPAGDDHGPGTYTYPTDTVFEKGVFDIERFTVSQNDQNLVLSFSVRGPIANPWGSGIGLSVQTFDVYIDADPGAGTGARKLLEGRNAALAEGNGWEYAVWVEGWNQKLIVPDADGKPVEVAGGPVKAIVNAARREVTILVSKKALGDLDPAKAGYVGVVASQEGYPAAGVRRIREVQADAAQWRIGGAPADTNHTRIIDVAWPQGSAPTQEQFLATYPASNAPSMDALKPEDFAQVPILVP
jgi:alpha-amylase/alpha-mannosidase (GH57 family)